MRGLKPNFKLNYYLSKKIYVQVLPSRRISGILRGFDQFLNLVLENGYLIEETRKTFLGTVLIRGNMIISIGNY